MTSSEVLEETRSDAEIAAEAQELRQVITAFIQERRDKKLEELDKKPPKDEGERQALEEKREELVAKHATDAWLEDAAHRVGQIQLVSFGLKFTHSSAKGTSIYLQPGSPDGVHVQTRCLGDAREDDIVGNAAALDVFAFLKQSLKDRTLLARAMTGDPALRMALSDDTAKGEARLQEFASIASGPEAEPASHTYAKQMYFPVDVREYHVLAPLFATSLANRLYDTINYDRFEDAAKGARSAHQAGVYDASGYREYVDLVIQKFGGTKPQNISQKNSARHGEAYLLPSIPPSWTAPAINLPRHTSSIFAGWLGRQPRIRRQVKVLRKFLASTTYNNKAIRLRRQALVASLCDEVLQLVAGLQVLPAGWTAGPDMRLKASEAMWLDPDRAANDADLSHTMTSGDWRGEVYSDFARWLNDTLRSDHLSLGDAEFAQWRSDIEAEMRNFRAEVDYHA